MSVSISALLQPVSADQVRATMVTGLVALGVPADKVRKGGWVSTILTVVATVYAAFWGTILGALSALFLETASGVWLVYVAKYVYGVTAIASTFASGQVTLTNPSGGIYPYGAGAASFLNPTTGVTYTNVDPFTLGAVSTVTIDVQATTIGSAGNAEPGSISQLVTSMLDVTVTNALSVIGLDAEADPVLRQRCLNRLGSRSNRGPRTSYQYYATSDAEGDPLLNVSGTPVNINRVSVSTASSTGHVSVYLASPSGAPTTDDLNAASDSMNLNARPNGVTLSVLAVTPITYATSMTVWCLATPGLDTTAVQTAIADAIALYLSTYPIGGFAKPPSSQGYLWASTIEGVVKNAHSAIVAVDGITVDLALNPGQVATDALLVANINVRLVQPS